MEERDGTLEDQTRRLQQFVLAPHRQEQIMQQQPAQHNNMRQLLEGQINNFSILNADYRKSYGATRPRSGNANLINVIDSICIQGGIDPTSVVDFLERQNLLPSDFGNALEREKKRKMREIMMQFRN